MKKISQTKLFFIILNTMLGGGVIVNLPILSQYAQSLSGFLYLLSYLMILPVILAMAKLANLMTTSDSMFSISKKFLGHKLGFLTAWTYFLGRAASVATLANTAFFMLQANFKLNFIQPDLGPILIIFALALLNIYGATISGFMQTIFILIKTAPIIILILLSSIYLNSSHFTFLQDLPLAQSNILASIPSSLYALLGFAVVLNIKHLTKESNKTDITIIWATLTATIISFLFQFFGYLVAGPSITSNTSSITHWTTNINLLPNVFKILLNNLALVAIISSAFNFLVSNSWNLQALAKEKAISVSNLFTKINKFHSPFNAILFHSLISSLFLLITKNIHSLQVTTVFFTVFSYLLCSLAYNYSNPPKIYLSRFGIISSLAICIISLLQIIKVGISYEFLFIFISGLFLSKNK